MFGLAIHGGAGTLPRAEMSGERERSIAPAWPRRSTRVMPYCKSGGTSLDAVTRAVMVLEDNPLFNAGQGSVFTFDGRNELDAVHHGRQHAQGRRCLRRDPHQEPDRIGAHRHGAFRLRHAERRRARRNSR